ncbi:DgyrCDS14564 [Dimorphilus gyrociliatus]|uniref:DgyrCDS14564 n=1 Tax=Dimorphilus gyrociliatus TaxID=2664684 RepID=A0A7I8WE79_9ANNE|nr:DgyrCDS14564 [Dimorphilus gyrociliatus]
MHTNHWICLQDNLCALCVSIKNCQAKIVLRRCDKKEFEAKQIVSDNEMIDSLITSDEIADENHPQEDLEDHKIGTYFYTDVPIAKDIIVVSQREGSVIEEIAANVQSNEDTNMNVDESSFEDVEKSILLTDGSFEIFENGSQKGKPLLLYNGFSYAVKQTRKCNRIWKCSGKNKKGKCPGSVNENGGNFTLGSKPHNHSLKKNLKQITKMKVQIKKRAESEKKTSALRIVEDAYIQQDTVSNFPKIMYSVVW